MKYSVLMSVFNKEKPEYLKKSIKSMLEQTIPPDEIVIVKDGILTKELDEVINNFQEKSPKLFNIISISQNIGLALALNKGIKHCKNELIARMDSDDISLPTRCEEQLREFEKDKELGIVGSEIKEFWNSEENIISIRKVPKEHDKIYKFAKRRSAFNHPTVMYKKNLVLKVGGYKNFRKTQDFNLFGRMLYSGVKAKNIPKSLLLFRLNDNFFQKRKDLLSVKCYIKASFDLWKLGYTNLFDFLYVLLSQGIIFLVPKCILKIIYKKILR